MQRMGRAHLVVDSIHPDGGVAASLTLHAVFLVAIDVVLLEQTRPVLIGDEASAAIVVDAVASCITGEYSTV